ncbi:MAG: hypothetical protein JNJ73_11515 [Hyphomonadaceae bacterium]|nr:hypothetical protein [Hyphomonadaceae bacterium]
MSAEDDRRKELLDRLSRADIEVLALAARLAGLDESAPRRTSDYLTHLRAVAASDVKGLVNAEKSYGVSWKLRGGIDTFHMLLRKWERVEKRAAEAVPAREGRPAASPYDVFEHIAADPQTTGLIDDIRDLRRYLMLGEAEHLARAKTGGADSDRGFLAELQPIADQDVATIEEKERAYGDSWRRNGGIGAFMIFARKWDRIKQRVSGEVPAKEGEPGAARDNILEHIAADRRAEPILDDIRDLRRFLLLTEAEMAARGAVAIGAARDDLEA